MKTIYPSEYDECVAFVNFLEIKGLKFSHLAQSTFSKSWGVKMKNQKMGVRRGVPDYLVIVPVKTGHVLCFVEMKRTKGGVISDEQTSWIESLNGIVNVQAKVCYGAEDAQTFIQSVMEHGQSIS